MLLTDVFAKSLTSERRICFCAIALFCLHNPILSVEYFLKPFLKEKKECYSAFVLGFFFKYLQQRPTDVKKRLE